MTDETTSMNEGSPEVSHDETGPESTAEPGETPAAEAKQAEGADSPSPREKVRTFPTTPGVYLMKDAEDRVIYVGKAVNLRSRAGSYFLSAAAEERRTADLVREIADIDHITTETEVDALLLEARLIKDIQPRFNTELKDDKTYPSIVIRKEAL